MTNELTNRANQLRTDTESKSTKLQTSRLVDIDSNLISYLKNKIVQGIVNEDNTPLSVPVIYASPELWKSVQADGYLRDTLTNKLRVPLLAIRRSNIARNRNQIKNLDANMSHVYNLIERSYTNLNIYDQFSAIHNIKPRKEYSVTIIPDFVTITYNCKIWTDYITHMNQVIEAINFADSAYWGDTDKYKFYTNVSDFGEIEEVSTTDGRSVRCDFNLTLRGFIIPQSIQKQLNSSQKAISIGSLGITFKEK